MGGWPIALKLWRECYTLGGGPRETRDSQSRGEKKSGKAVSKTREEKLAKEMGGQTSGLGRQGKKGWALVVVGRNVG